LGFLECLQEIDVELEVCIGRLNHLLGDSADSWEGQEVAGDDANGGRKSPQQDSNVASPACVSMGSTSTGKYEPPRSLNDLMAFRWRL
jgi:hypothetical protein